MVETAAAATAPKRFISLDSARGIAACMVVVEHLSSNGVLTGSDLGRNGWIAVNFFFVLSGFVICGNYADRLSDGFGFGRYMFLRLGRIWPVHAFVLAVLLALELLKLAFADLQAWRAPFADDHSPANFAISLFLLRAFQPSAANAWSPQSWSLSVELILYVLFGALWAWRRSLSTPVALATFLGIATLELLVPAAWTDIPEGLVGFSAGVVTWAIYRRFADRSLAGGKRRADGLELTCSAACIGVATFADRMPPGLPEFVFALAILVFAYDAGVVSRLLARPLPRHLGRVSLSIYLMHSVVSGRMYDIFGWIGGKLGVELVTRDESPRSLVAGPFTSDVLALFVLLAVIVVATFTYRWIEAPARSLSRKLVEVAPHPASPARPERWW